MSLDEIRQVPNIFLNRMSYVATGESKRRTRLGRDCPLPRHTCSKSLRNVLRVVVSAIHLVEL